MKHLMKALMVLITIVSLQTAAEAQFLIRKDPAIQIGYNSYRFLSFGKGSSTPNNGQFAAEFCDGCDDPGFNIWRPWPEPGASNYLFFIRQKDNNVGIGTSGDGSFKLDVAGKVRSFGFATISDKRLKTNIQNLSDPLSKILRLNGVSYKYNFSFPKDTIHSGDTNIIKRNTIAGEAPITASSEIRLGLIAQDVQQVVPEVVSTDDKGYMSINYQELVPLLIESIKEQQKQIEEMKKVLSYINVAKNPNSLSYLDQNTPNPFSATTTIGYHIQETTAPSQVLINVYDKDGNLFSSHAVTP